MKQRVSAASACVAALAMCAWATPASAQIGGLGDMLHKAQQVRDLHISDEQEEQIGAAVSARVRERYGVVQDPALHRYVSLVGAVLAQASSRPNLPWKFIILDTDGVNAFAAPGGFVHITRGALGLMTSEAELAGVLGHEMTHVTEKHTIHAIQKEKALQAGVEDSNLAPDSPLFNKLVDKATDMVMAGFGRSEEMEADQKGLRLANQVGYAPTGLTDFLERLKERNGQASSKQGLFASHPEMQERIDTLKRQIAKEHLGSTATLNDRYRSFITFKTTGVAIAGIEQGSAGLAGDTKEPDKKDPNAKDGTKDDAPKKKGFGLSSLLAPGSSEKKSAEVTGSGAARGVDRELGAKGGPVKAIVVVSLTPADIAAFKKEGNLR